MDLTVIKKVIRATTNKHGVEKEFHTAVLESPNGDKVKVTAEDSLEMEIDDEFELNPVNRSEK